ncbi:MAG: hypothetical protein DMG40_13460 [Acidobacteria bacterium]|nr:MAG: hypothetical protein DMG40_13460 [Acidobacteriota bacterium]
MSGRSRRSGRAVSRRDVPGKPLKVRWLKRALVNLRAEAEYISRDSHAAAQPVVLAIGQAVQLLAPATPPWTGQGASRGLANWWLRVRPYIIPYRVREDRVEVLRVFHTARKWPPHL